MNWFWPNSMNRIWYRTRTGHDPVPPPAPFDPFHCQVCGSPGSTICPWCTYKKEAPVGDVTRPQQDPKPGVTSVTDLVIADLNERRKQGIAKYGGELKTQNGRKALVDAYQESLDQTMYLRQAVEEDTERERESLVTEQMKYAKAFAERDPAQLDLFDSVTRATVAIAEDPTDWGGGCMSPGGERAMPVVPKVQTAREFIDTVKHNPITGELLKDTGIVGRHVDTIVWDDPVTQGQVTDDTKKRILAETMKAVEAAGGVVKVTDWKKYDDELADLLADSLPAETILQEAQRLVHGDRGEAYGHPLDDMGRTAGMLTSLLSDKLKAALDARDIAMMMVCVKLSRERNKPKRDNRVDGCGYFETLQMVMDETERRSKQ